MHVDYDEWKYNEPPQVKHSSLYPPLHVAHEVSHRLHVEPTAYSLESHEAVHVFYNESKYNEPAQLKHSSLNPPLHVAHDVSHTFVHVCKIES